MEQFVNRDSVEDLKKRIVNCIKILNEEGVFELTYGHISCRIPNSDKFLILGHLHESNKNLFDVTEEDIVTMDIEGETLPGEVEAPGERFIHTEVYKRRPEVEAIVHCHPILSTSFSISGVPIMPVNNLGTIFAPEVPIHDYSGQVDTAEKAAAMAETLGNRMAVVLRSHGATIVGSSVEKAALNTLALEHTAKMQLIAHQVGTPRPIPVEETDGIFSEGTKEREYYDTAWDFYSRKYQNHLLKL
ncbi:class II aldolase/adducin family protein [Halalkalibacter oceani]|uniref:Class II aldolase/adducin family protein n=1 Tax=Halalkalibacter oceani TaxID=1653776 RepID=A0A9X2INP2_9BACI|nr:class II aldolase/adducin family protein [Halalkalibacter oceani]MCM3713991.1 class II aldolase/adducin family protein [Halalkalibacter oceani]